MSLVSLTGPVIYFLINLVYYVIMAHHTVKTEPIGIFMNTLFSTLLLVLLIVPFIPNRLTRYAPIVLSILLVISLLMNDKDDERYILRQS